MCTVTPLVTLPVKFKYTENGFKLTALWTGPCKTHSYMTILLTFLLHIQHWNYSCKKHILQKNEFFLCLTGKITVVKHCNYDNHGEWEAVNQLLPLLWILLECFSMKAVSRREGGAGKGEGEMHWHWWGAFLINSSTLTWRHCTFSSYKLNSQGR